MEATQKTLTETETRFEAAEHYVRQLIYTAVEWAKGETDSGTTKILKGALSEGRHYYDLLKMAITSTDINKTPQYFEKTFIAEIDHYDRWCNDRPGVYAEIKNFLENIRRIINTYVPDAVPDKVNHQKITGAGIAIMHSYWSEQDHTKAITKTNAKTWAQHYGCSHNTLLRKFNDFNDRDRRMKPANVENRRSINYHIKYFEDFLPLLKTLCPKAFDVAEKDFNTLKNKY